MKKDEKKLDKDFEFWEDLEVDSEGAENGSGKNAQESGGRKYDEAEYDEPGHGESKYEESEYDESEYDEQDDLELEENVSLNPKKIALFCGLFLLAVLICIPLWMVTHSRMEKEGAQGNGTEQTKEAPEGQTDALAETDAANQEGVPESLQETQSGEPSDPAATQSWQTGQNGSQTAGTSQTQSPDDSRKPPAESGGQNQSETAGQSQNQNAGSAGQSQTSGTENQTLEGSDPVDGDTSMSYTETGDSVTAKDVTNLRSAPSTSDEANVVGQLKNGETLKRRGMNESTGWSVLEYNGQTVYAVTRYLTTDLSYKTPVTPANPNRVSTKDGRVIIFADWDDYITPKEYVNLRTEPSTSEGDATVRCQVNNGEKVHRTGYSQDSGWSRVEYNGEILYVVTSLTTAVPATEG